MNTVIWFDFYKNFNHCKDLTYIYKDNKNDKNLSCIDDILKFVSDLCKVFKKKYEYKVYSLKTNEQLFFEEIFNVNFIIYSTEEALDNKEYFIYSKNIMQNYLNFNDWYNQSGDGIVIENDPDGGGLYFYANLEKDENDWLLDYFKSFKIEMYKLKCKRGQVQWR